MVLTTWTSTTATAVLVVAVAVVVTTTKAHMLVIATAATDIVPILAVIMPTRVSGHSWTLGRGVELRYRWCTPPHGRDGVPSLHWHSGSITSR